MWNYNSYIFMLISINIFQKILFCFTILISFKLAILNISFGANIDLKFSFDLSLLMIILQLYYKLKIKTYIFLIRLNMLGLRVFLTPNSLLLFLIELMFVLYVVICAQLFSMSLILVILSLYPVLVILLCWTLKSVDSFVRPANIRLLLLLISLINTTLLVIVLSNTSIHH